MQRLVLSALFFGGMFAVNVASGTGTAKYSVLIVWDGLRPDSISATQTPSLFQLARDGVMFQNHHSVYLTATEVNGTALATGAYPAHSGIIANRDYRPELNPLKPVATESPDTVKRADQLTDGNHLLRPTVAEILHAAGRRTVVAGTKAVALLHDRGARRDDSPDGVTLFEGKAIPPTVLATITNSLGAFPSAPGSQSNIPNEQRDQWSTRAMLGTLWSNGVPDFSLLWLSEPDHSQHAAGPGSEKALAALASSDRQLAAVLHELDARNLRDQTDVFVVSDHGFSTVERSVDVCEALQTAGFQAQREFKSPPRLGDILVIAQGGSDLFYVTGSDAPTIRRLVAFLQQQDFTGVIFTRQRMQGTFTLAEGLINCPNPPDVVISLRWSSATNEVAVPGLLVADAGPKAKQGTHASLSKFDVHNTLVAAGPDLKRGFTDTLPTGNTDLAPTILWLLGVKPKVPMDGRVLSEALTVKSPRVTEPKTRRLEASRPIGNSAWSQHLQISRVNDTIYLDEGNGGMTPK
jgi:arylsulfatase A-like enzyme